MSETKTVWHKWPEEQPPEGVMLLVTYFDEEDEEPFIGTAWVDDGNWDGPGIFRYEVIAWAYPPEPYKPE